MRRQPLSVRATLALIAAAAGVGSLPTLAAVTPAAAQAGAAVGATSTGEALVLRPTSGRGRAAVLVFARTAEGWVRVADLEPGARAEPYEGFSPYLAAAADVIAAGGGDDDGRWGARVFQRAADGGWSAARVVPFDPGPLPEVSTRPAALDMAGLMRIMSPPHRVVALSPDGGTLAVWNTVTVRDSVRVFEAGGAGGWRHAASLPVIDSGQAGPVMLTAGDDRIVVADPAREGGGVVRVFLRRGGVWTLESDLAGDGGERSGFGFATALHGDRLAVAMPGARAVATYQLVGGTWSHTGSVRPPDPALGDDSRAFGMAVAWNDGGLWVGSAGEEGGRGAIHRFAPDGAGELRHAGRFVVGDAPASFGLGRTLAASDGLVVAGAPAAGAGIGGAAVIERRDGTWTGPVLLETSVELESVAGGEVRCEDGVAAGFDCGNVDLLSFMTIADLGADSDERVTDIWGWADPETGREYALVGRTAGMAVVDVTRPESPATVALVRANRAGLRDIKVFRDHAFMVGDGAGDHGLVVFDLRRLRDLPAGEPATLEPDARYTGIGSAHNLIMETETGLAIPVGASGGGETCGGGLHMVDVSSPTEPTFAGCYTDTSGLIAPGRSHDGQCVVYRGPDRDYAGRRVCFASNETAVRIVDVTDPAAPVQVSRSSYPGVAYTHQGWLTDDQRYFFMNDELDELVGTTERTRTLIWDVADLDDPVLVGEHLGPDIATDHNLFIRGDRMYQANYQAGLRVVDISDPENPRDVGFFDTTPYGPNHAGFGGGAWTAYPFLPSGTVLVSSMYEGLFLLKPRPEPIP